jgi:hypothetical protein
MIRMQISLTGITELQGSLDRIRAVAHDFTPELREIGEWYMGFLINDVFETEGGVIGEPWAPLNPEYAKEKAEHYPGRGILEASGKMRTSWRLYTTAQYALIENYAQSDGGEYYAKFHQEGTRKMPRRVVAESRMIVSSGARVYCPSRCPASEAPAPSKSFDLIHYPSATSAPSTSATATARLSATTELGTSDSS